MNYDEATDEPRIRFNYQNTDTQAEYARSDKEEVQLRGITVPDDDLGAAQALLRRWFSSMRSTFGRKRRVYEAIVPAYRALALNPGDVITLSDDLALRYDATRGLEGEHMRLISIEQVPDTNRYKLRMIWRDANGAGWAPAMRVASVVDADTLVVEANAYSGEVHHITGEVQRDAGFFSVGDSVQCVPLGNWANRVQTTITAISGNTLTFAAAHTLKAGDNIRPGRFQSVSSVLQQYCYLANEDGLLGAGVEGKTYG
jgi:hypothetical protein